MLRVRNPLLLTILTVVLSPLCRAQSDVTDGKPPQKLSDTGAKEGPAWHPELGLLTTGEGAVIRHSLDGIQSVYIEGAGTNGLMFNREGTLLMCQPMYRRVSRRDADGTVTVLADRFGEGRFNAPNDLTIDSKNRIYFTDPQYGARTEMEIVDTAGRKVEGVYRIDPDGSVSRVITHEVDRPNGIVVTPDDQTIYVADNNNNAVGGARKLWRFNLLADGSVDVASRNLVYDWGTSRGPDGMKLDEAGRLFVAAGLTQQNPPFETQAKSTAGIYVFSPQGKLLQFVPIPVDEVTNCAFGGEDLRTIFVTAGGTLWSFRTLEPGSPVWPRLP